MKGHILGKYRIIEPIGQGATGTVYKAEHREQGRTVALKRLHPGFAEDRSSVERFLREAKATSTFSHPNIVTLYDVGCEGESYYIAMEYVDGHSLAQVLREEGKLPVGRAVGIGIGVCRALDCAHLCGIVHRDIKPGNIMICRDGTVKVADFGLAKMADVSDLTRTGSVLGTSEYLSPEQATEGKADARSDLYSLGVVMYEMLTGRVPFSGESAVSVIYRHINEQPLPLREWDVDIPREVEEIVLRLLEKDPQRRYPSARDLSTDLERVGKGEIGSETGRPSVRERLVRPFYTVLVGREREWGILRHRLDRALSGEGTTIFLVGEAGIGKTRLAEELHLYANRRNVRFLTGRCSAVGADPYLPFAEILREYFGIEEGDSAVLKEQKIRNHIERRCPELEDIGWIIRLFLLPGREVPGDVFSSDEARGRKGVLFRTFAQFLIRVSRRRPLALFLDNLHSADSATLEMLDYVVGRVRDFRILLMGAYRPENRSDELSHRVQRMKAEGLCEGIELGRLTEEDVSGIVESFFTRADWPADLLSQIYRGTEGNPLFVLETLKLLRDEGIVEEEDGVWRPGTRYEEGRLPVPSLVQDILLTRIGHLSGEDRALLECASVEGEIFSSETLSVLLKRERADVLRRLNELETIHQLIHSSGEKYRFDHARIRDILYERMSSGLRKEYHRLMGTFKEERHKEDRDPILFELAHHFYLAGDDERSLPYLIKAGDNAVGSYAHREAIENYDRALEVMERVPGDVSQQRAGVYGRLGDVHYAAGNLDRAIESYECLLAYEKDKRRRADTVRKIGRAYREGHRSERALRYLRKAKEELSNEGDCTELARVYLDLAWFHKTDTVDFEKAFELYRRSLEILKGTENLPDLAKAYSGFGFCQAVRGNWDEGMAYLQRGIEISERTGDLFWKGIIHCEFKSAAFALKGDLKGAIECVNTAVEIFERIGSLFWAAVGHAALASHYKSKGDTEGSVEHFQKAVQVSEKGGYVFPLIGALANLGQIHSLRGEHEKAIRCLKGSIEKALDLGTKNWTVSICLFTALRRLERTLDAMGRREEFIPFCREARDGRPEDVKRLGLVQWWLEPQELSDTFERLDAVDTFRGPRLSSIWRWERDPGDGCTYDLECNPGLVVLSERRDPTPCEISESHSPVIRNDPARLLREISGDFAMETEVSAPLRVPSVFTMSTAQGPPEVNRKRRAPHHVTSGPNTRGSPSANRGAQVGAVLAGGGPYADKNQVMHPSLQDSGKAGGLIVWKDRENYAVLRVDEHDEVVLYCREGGSPQIVGRGYIRSPVHHLRIEREGDRIKARCGSDGENWCTCGELTVKMEDPVWVGIYAYCHPTVKRTAAKYEHFKILRREAKTVKPHPPSPESEISGMDTSLLPREQLAALCKVSRIVSSTLDLDEMLRRAIEVLVEVTGAERGLVILTDSRTGDLEVKAGKDIDMETVEDARRISQGIVRDVAGSGRPIISLDAKTDPRFKDRGSVRLYDIRSVMCVPLNVKGGIIGTVYLDRRGKANAFSPKDSAFFEALGDQIALAIENARLYEQLHRENVHLKQEVERIYRFPNLIGSSSRMRELFDLLEKVIPTSATVLIQGETGTGKELIARAIHYNGPRRDKRFIPQSCAALPGELLESELFGHKKGAFTGATADKAGIFEAADGGTIFLDEISDAAPSTQAKILRVLEEGEIRRLGENEPRTVDVRILSATNRDLKAEVEKGRFREDLYYRLSGICINVPPLRERKEDIPLLVRHFLNLYGGRMGRRVKGIAKEAMDILLRYPWPGNVRELEHVVERALILSEGEYIEVRHLPEDLTGGEGASTDATSLEEARASFEKAFLEAALRRTGGNVSQAAAQVRLTRKNFYLKMEKYGIDVQPLRGMSNVKIQMPNPLRRHLPGEG